MEELDQEFWEIHHILSYHIARRSYKASVDTMIVYTANSKLEKAYYRADDYIEKITELLAA